MPNIGALLKTEIARVARKELRAEMEAVRKTVLLHRTSIATLKRQVHELEQQLARSKRELARTRSTEPAAVQEHPRLRFRSAGFAALRQKLGISAASMGRLIGVTGQSIYAWESGKARPRGSQLEAIAAVRKLGKREVLKRLDQMAQ